eukprot:TRINITY_DN43000_c0_g1_i1.p1 TRINITY_DN43000_c0_g1~~TRINITY_DN43000_c0_g1_i1.p1  ORF type:complete len:361 (+),score=41.24 TRINITY_DN43000_c0_g1_i1:58-1140(+)
MSRIKDYLGFSIRVSRGMFYPNVRTHGVLLRRFTAFAWLVCVGFTIAADVVRDGRAFQVLLTGFGPFKNISHNPSEAIARRLGPDCDDVAVSPTPGSVLSSREFTRICWHTRILPVNETGAVWTTEHLRELWDRRVHGHVVDGSDGSIPYDAVVHLGVEDFAKGLKLEIAASNTLASDPHLPAVAGGAQLLATTVNTGWLDPVAIGAAAKLNGTQAELWSRNAGDFYCNEVYYRTLDFIRTENVIVNSGALLPAVFVHVPNVRTDTVEADSEAVKQIVAHVLWATYSRPGSPLLPCVALSARDSRDGPAGTLQISSLAFGVAFSFGAGAIASVLLVTLVHKRQRTTIDSRLGEPLVHPCV